MSRRPDDLPDFTNPPVVEVVLGVQFDRLRQLRQAHFGLFWDVIRDRFPHTFDHPRLETPVEPLESTGAGPSFQLEMLDSPPTHRTWFVSADDERLVQLQDDRLLHNWRHRGGPYPRFDSLRDDFWGAFESLASVLTSVELPPIQPQQVEVSYINWISGLAPMQFLRSAPEGVGDVEGVDPRPVVEQWLAQHLVLSEGVLVGRLTVETKPGAIQTEDRTERGHLLSFTYLAPVGPDAPHSDIDAHFERGREVIVRSFASITDHDMHAEDKWGRVR